MPLSIFTRVTLLDAARHSIEQNLNGNHAMFTHENADPALHIPRACFVTLKRHNVLRGCIGSLDVMRALLDDVMYNAQHAAFHDPRFPPLVAVEMQELHIEISVLSMSKPIVARSRAELLRTLRPGEDGVTAQDDSRRATFLPAVWSSLPKPSQFYDELMRKAGLGADYWSETLRFFRYHTESFSDEEDT